MKNKKEAKASAKEQITNLFAQAKQSEKHAQKYVRQARKLALKHRIRLSKETKRTFCANCDTLFRPGKNCLIRIRKKYITIHCKQCLQNTRTAL